MKISKWTLIALVFFFLAATAANAHMIWVTPDNRAPKAGEAVTLGVDEAVGGGFIKAA